MARYIGMYITRLVLRFLKFGFFPAFYFFRLRRKLHEGKLHERLRSQILVELYNYTLFRMYNKGRYYIVARNLKTYEFTMWLVSCLCGRAFRSLRDDRVNTLIDLDKVGGFGEEEILPLS